MAVSRKNELKALFGGGLAPAAPSGVRAPEVKSMPPQAGQPDEAGHAGAGQGEPAPRSASSAVKAMGLSLNAITREAEEARALRQALLEGERVVSVDPARIEASFVEDRLTIDGADDADFASLVESVRESGQQVPVLLRPHPEREGVFQTAYGHRRVKAAIRLGREVKAIVRPLSDAELVLAQGKENAERRNLSFIERGLFAQNLAARGFDRKVIGDALAVQKSELSRLLQVVEGVPERFIRAIGPAPKAGRDRWMKLGEILKSEAKQVIAVDVIYSEAFKAVDSDTRFQMLFSRLDRRAKPEVPAAEELKDGKGRVFAWLRRDGKAPRIEFATGTDAAFVDEAAGLLALRYDEFLRKREEN
ncbi:MULTISPECIES: plasmid partitioning protein RepB [Alphaproteobacteria]|uniref:Plasmid partitioning protein RepB n=2 Tax=Alphaproteobacteria TaxID=28211 RepID=A0A512HGU4_9HYPH|nr:MULTISPECIES: plasmid partitioning protein RepB [Alphaproteobacteria]GEO84679.1 plasmid partitioning protein RepB [Ciceribacter naphthalenivorans]GLR20700.1 plasmid partitioning protein RepB [Ciceribacter naphthalenivorans]GLT03556.1 plasmid partitioning protein RepB [Sphingomonas psychrolutea]